MRGVGGSGKLVIFLAGRGNFLLFPAGNRIKDEKFINKIYKFLVFISKSICGPASQLKTCTRFVIFKETIEILKS